MIAIKENIKSGEWESLRRIEHPLLQEPKRQAIKRIYKQMKHLAKFSDVLLGTTMRNAKHAYRDTIENEKVYVNDLYYVFVNEEKDWIHLSIKTHEKSVDSIITWQHKQWIKNDICGVEAEGVELFPAESRMVNSANQYHIWVLTGNEKFSCGWHEGRLVTDGNVEGAKQTLQKRR
tara:strand:+ start:525 stop:1052 length:528 start_codon:yes stop_codon:yes gene_type:complete